MNTRRARLPAAFALTLALTFAAAALLMPAPATAQRANAPLAAVEGEVIVAFKPDAGTLRKHALSARADSSSARATLDGRAAALGARVGRTLQAGDAVGERVQLVRASGIDAATLARQLAADPDVLYAVPNGRKRRTAAPNDPLYPAALRGANGPDSGQWYLRAPDATIRSSIDIEAAWTRTTGSGVVVAVLDTGVRFDHPDLGRVANGGNLLPGYDFVADSTVANDGGGRDADPSDPGDWVTSAEANGSTFRGCTASDSSWHGTSTSSLVGALTNNNAGMAGAAYGARVLPVRVLGKCFGSDSDIIAGMRWAAGLTVAGVPANPNPARVLNLSLGGDGACSAAYQDAVNEITAAGVLIVAAAGNSVGHPVSEPANCNGVIGVVALRHVGTKVGFSDMGPQISIAAPGGNCVNLSGACLYPILAATNTGTTTPLASGYTDSFNITVGTSFASPLTAAVAALMIAQRPALTPAQTRAAMMSSARAFPTTGAGNGTNGQPVPVCPAPVAGVDQDQCYCTTSTCGAGMLDAGRAVAAVNGALARIDVTTTTPTAAAAVNLSGGNSTAGPGATVASYAWSIVSGGGIVTAFSSATNASTASLTPTAAGSFTVQLVVTDSAGSSNTTTSTVTVAAASGGNPPATGGDSGGGAASVAWVAGVGLAAFVLARMRLSAFSARRRSGSPARRA